MSTFRGLGARRAPWIFSSVALVALVALGCGSSSSPKGTGTSGASSGSTSSGSTSGSTSSGGTGGTSTTITCSSQPSTLSLTGTWAAYAELSVKLNGQPGGAVTICPADQVAQATLLVLVTITQDTTDPTKLDQVQATLCSVELPTTTALVGTCDPTSDALITTQLIVPQAFIDALPKVAAATTTGTLGGTSPGASLSVNALDTVVGATTSGSMLPTWDTTDSTCSMVGEGSSTGCDTTCVSDCTDLRDDDADGYPGVTIQVCGRSPSDTKNSVPCNATTPTTAGTSIQGEGFIDLEVNPELTSTVTSSCEVTGTVATEVVYNLVGANVYLGGAPISVTSAIESLPTFQVDPTASKFRMVRIDGMYGAPDWKVDPTQKSAACATLNKNVNQL